MFRLKHKKLLIIPVLLIILGLTVFNIALAQTNTTDISQLLKKFQDSDNPIESTVINSNTNILADNMDTLDNALKAIYSEPAVSDNYDKICPLFDRSNIEGIKLFVDGKLIEFSKYNNVNPVIIEDRVFVPVRAIVESLGAKVDWNESTNQVKVQHFDKVIEIVPDSSTMLINGQQVAMDTPARIIDGRLLLPVRYISETLSRTVEWHAYDDSLNVIAIY